MERDYTLDFGRCLAALFVVYVHFDVCFLPLYQSMPFADWMTANVMNSIGRVCVPLFVMMSGALILQKRSIEWGPFIRKRTAATLKPYLFGALLYLVWQYSSTALVSQPIFASYVAMRPQTVFGYVSQFLLGGAYLQLYFLFILFGLYLISPLLLNIHALPKEALIGITAILFAIDIVDRHLGPLGLTLGYMTLGNCFTYLPYFLAGYVLYKVARPPEVYAVPMFVASTGVTACLIWFTTKYATTPYDTGNFVQYTSANVVVQSLFAFCALLQVRIASPKIREIVARLSALTLGVYIIHIVVLIEMTAVISWFAAVPTLIQILLFPPLCFAISCVLVIGLRKIPMMRGFV